MIVVLGALVVASWVFWVVAWLCTESFFRQPQEHAVGFTPPVSILKPIRGAGQDAYECLRTYVLQDYPEYEVLVGVLDGGDPATEVVARLQREYPGKVRLVVADPVGLNNKVSILHALVREARYSTLAVSDSDMRVARDYLRRVVAPLRDPRVGLVTCPYVGDRPLTLTARLEALYIGTTFLPLIMVARRYLQTRFSTGASAVMRRRDLERIGGFAALADYLADDYQLGYQMSASGQRVHLADYVPRTVLGHTSFRDQWQREVRWTRCSRVSRPLEYPAVLITLTTPLALILALVARLSVQALILLAISMILRFWVAWKVTGLTGDQASRQWMPLLPLRDALTAAVWVAGLAGRTVYWRAERLRLAPGGKLAPVQGEPEGGGRVRRAWYRFQELARRRP